jgi:hypothetical protein
VKSQLPALEPWGLYIRLGAVAFVLVIDLILRLVRRRENTSTPQIEEAAPTEGDDATPPAASQTPEWSDMAQDKALTD